MGMEIQEVSGAVERMQLTNKVRCTTVLCCKSSALQREATEEPESLILTGRWSIVHVALLMASATSTASGRCLSMSQCLIMRGMASQKKAHHSQGSVPCLAPSSALLLETRHRAERRPQQGRSRLGPSRTQDNGHERDRLRQRRQDDGGQIQDDGGAGPAQIKQRGGRRKRVCRNRGHGTRGGGHRPPEGIGRAAGRGRG